MWYFYFKLVSAVNNKKNNNFVFNKNLDIIFIYNIAYFEASEFKVVVAIEPSFENGT